MCIQVNKRDVRNYTGDGEPPFCMITIKLISDETPPPDLECTVILMGVDVPNRLQLIRKVEYSSSSQLCELNMHIFFLSFKMCSYMYTVVTKPCDSWFVYLRVCVYLYV